jgi:hypothetical protein
MNSFSSLGNSFLSYISDLVYQARRNIEAEVEYRISVYKKIIIRNIMGYFMIAVSLFFICIALIYFMIEYLEWSRTISFAVVGIILLIAGIITRK